MKFKNILCFVKANKNHTKTERDECKIIFNDSKVEFVDDVTLDINICDREVLFVGSSEELKDLEGKRVIVNWVEFFEEGSTSFELPNDTTDVLFITKSIYEELRLRGLSFEDIYKMFREKGLGEMLKEVSKISDFCALTAKISE